MNEDEEASGIIGKSNNLIKKKLLSRRDYAPPDHVGKMVRS